MAFLKNISLQQLFRGAATTFLKYPLMLLSAFIGTWAAIDNIDVPHEQRQTYTYLLKLVQVSALGLILFFVLELVSRRYTFSLLQRALCWTAGVAFLVVYYLLLPSELEAKQVMRFLLLALLLHLVASYAMFFNRREENAFWQFNKSLFLRILTSGLYAAVLFIGLSLAVLAVDNLFDVEVKPTLYPKLWLLLVGVFNTWFFLAGVPEDVEELEQNDTYPKGLKVFTQFVLLPLVTLYLVILYLYFGKIVLAWDWPKGWVSVLVLCFSIAGILSLLLIHPIRYTEGNAWIRTFSRWFFRALFPLIILLMLAIWRRVSEYGITEERYFVLVLALWLFCTALYFLSSRQKNIKFVPVTLSLVALVSAVGPFSAFRMSERSQLGRLKGILEQQGLLVGGKIIPASQNIEGKAEKEISSIVHYLDEVHGLESIKPWFRVDVDSALARHQETLKVQRIYDRNDAVVVMELMGLDDRQESYMGGNLIYFNTAESRQQEVWHVSGYDYMLNFHVGAEKMSRDQPVIPDQFRLGQDSLRVEYQPERAGQEEALRFAYSGDTVVLVLQPLLSRLRELGRNELTQEEMTQHLKGQKYS
ncbi:DUF4153 domain-containing protein, partial [Pontibacter sp. HJ8]